jgi:peptidoglycan/xylan/chitin deacetylase (PgdA/CDA1 family)
MSDIKIFRDDDISVTSNCDLLRHVHELFIKYNKTHTIAVLMKDIWENKEIWYWMMTAPNLEICLHGWDHKDYSVMNEEDIRKDLNLCLNYWEKELKDHKKEYIHIKKFLPPWNRVNATLIKICDEFGLEVDNRIGGLVYNFHYWCMYDQDRMKALEEALRQ